MILRHALSGGDQHAVRRTPAPGFLRRILVGQPDIEVDADLVEHRLQRGADDSKGLGRRLGDDHCHPPFRQLCRRIDRPRIQEDQDEIGRHERDPCKHEGDKHKGGPEMMWADWHHQIQK